MTVCGKVFEEILAELRHMRHISDELLLAGKDSSDALIQMASYLSKHQQIIDYIIEDSQKKHELLMKGINCLYKRLASQVRPEIIGGFRSNTRIISSEADPVISQNKSILIKYAEHSAFDIETTNRAYYRTGIRLNVSTTVFQNLDEGFSSSPVTPQLLRVVSSSTSDTAPAGTGARSILLSGLNQNFERTFEVVILSGTVAVQSSNQFTYLDGVLVTEVGANRFAVGNITVTNLGNTVTYGRVAANNNSWRSGRFYTSATDAAYVDQWAFSSFNANIRAELGASIVSGLDIGAEVARSTGVAENDTFSFNLPIPIRVPQLGDIIVRALARNPNADAYTSFEVHVRPERIVP